MNHRHTQIEAAFHASGIGADPLIGAIVQARQLQYFRNASFECFAAHSVKFAEEAQVFTATQFGIDGQILSADADALSECEIVAPDRRLK